MRLGGCCDCFSLTIRALWFNSPTLYLLVFTLFTGVLAGDFGGRTLFITYTLNCYKWGFFLFKITSYSTQAVCLSLSNKTRHYTLPGEENLWWNWRGDDRGHIWQNLAAGGFQAPPRDCKWSSTSLSFLAAPFPRGFDVIPVLFRPPRCVIPKYVVVETQDKPQA